MNNAFKNKLKALELARNRLLNADQLDLHSSNSNDIDTKQRGFFNSSDVFKSLESEDSMSDELKISKILQLPIHMNR